jgi:hypothetical protein
MSLRASLALTALGVLLKATAETAAATPRERSLLPLWVAVGKTPGEPAGSLVRVGSENRHLVRRTQPARRERRVHGGSEVHLRKRAALFLRRLFPTASWTRSSDAGALQFVD